MATVETFSVSICEILEIGCRLHNSLSTRDNKTGPKLVMSWIISEHASHMNDLACKCSDKWISCKTMYVHVGRITRSFIPKTSVNNLHTKIIGNLMKPRGLSAMSCDWYLRPWACWWLKLATELSGRLEQNEKSLKKILCAWPNDPMLPLGFHKHWVNCLGSNPPVLYRWEFCVFLVHSFSTSWTANFQVRDVWQCEGIPAEVLHDFVSRLLCFEVR